MKKIEFDAEFEGSIKIVEISRPMGGGGSLQLMIGKYYQGSFVFRNGEWVWLPQKGHLTDGEVYSLLKFIDDHFGPDEPAV